MERCTDAYCQRCEDAKPRPQSWPGEEGYCRECHMIVAVDGGLLMDHRGAFAKHFDNAACMGTGKEPTPVPADNLDPWEAS
jgi:hypothetical protein